MQNEESIPHLTIRNILTRDFVLGFLAVFAFTTAVFALVPVLPIYLARLGSNVTEIGVLVGAYSVSSLVLRLLVGKALLRYSEKSVMMCGAMLFAFTFLACIVFRPFWPFFVVRFLQGTAFACLDTAVFAFIINVIPVINLGRGLAYFSQATMFAMALGPSFGMFIINHYNFTVLFMICTGLSLCTFFFSCKVKGKEIIKPDTTTPVHNSHFVDLKIIPPAITSLLHMFVFGALAAFIPLYAVQCGISNPGLFFSAMAVMIMAGRALGGGILDTYSKEKLILICIFGSMVTMVVLSFSKTLSMLIFVGALWGVGGSFLIPASMAYGLDYAGSSDGTAIGTFRGLTDLGLALGPMVMGLIVPVTGYPVMFLCLASICLINLCYFQFYVRRRGNVAPKL